MIDVRIKVDLGDFETAYAELKNLRVSLDEHKKTLQDSYATIQAGWNGSAAGAFNEHAPKLLADYSIVTAKMEKTAMNIKKVETDMHMLDVQLSNLH
jgi:uncharacterized protein YukE